MKIEDFAYRVAEATLSALESKFHYRFADDHKKAILEQIRADSGELIHERPAEEEPEDE